MSDEMMTAFEKLWVTLRASWCDNHDLNGALAFSHDRAAMDFFHRVVQVSVDDPQVDRLIDDALRLFQEKKYNCMFTLSPLDRPADLGERLERHGFREGELASVMVYDPLTDSPPAQTVAEIDVSPDGEYDLWADVMCRGFGHDQTMGEVGRSVLVVPEVRRYLARVDGAPAGTTLVYSQFGMGYVDHVATLPEHRRKGVASAMIARAIADSEAMGNRWTTLETMTDSNAERVYQRQGFRIAYHRRRYIMPHG